MEMMPNKRSNQAILITKNFFEKSLWQHKKLIVGIDEVGRGCLAGPLVAAAVILPIGKTSSLLQDSKILDAPARQKAYTWITKRCFYQVGIVHNRIIDKHNIWQATLLAMKRALVNLLSFVHEQPGAIIVDAMPLKLEDTGLIDIPVYYFPKGESRSSSIAAASIVAKVTRDNLMATYDQIFPGYAFKYHKGYATKTHQECLAKERHLIIHRQSFLTTFDDHKEHNEQCNQQTIC
jgi:ribonuclease HII